MNTRYSQLLEYFPLEMRTILEGVFRDLGENIQEIRVRGHRPLIAETPKGCFVVRPDGTLSPAVGGAYIVSENDVNMLFRAVCENSVYAYLDEIRQGFITVRGGHRVGFCGRVTTDGNKIETFRDISSINIRIARQVVGAANYIIDRILNADGTLSNTLLVSPPGTGKTTILRDLARQLSDKGIKTAIADDRGEIASLYKGIPQNDVGIQTDVIENAPKDKSINILLRTMSPKLIITDEISTEDDCRAVMNAFGTGVSVVASTHGSSAEEIMQRPYISGLVGGIGFEKIIVLSREGTGQNTRILGKVTTASTLC